MARAEKINPSILAWARETAGLSLADAANRIGITDSAILSAAEKLEVIERGGRYPTRNQLAKIASVYRRPLITFYLRQPPPKASRGEDFRTLPADVPSRESAKLDALLRDIRARQGMVRSLLEDEEAPRLDFVASATVPRGVQSVIDDMIAKLGLRIDAHAHRNGTANDLFKDLRTRAERIGVFVLLVGDLGSHHHVISERVFRGFAIADPIAPFIVINDQDARTARAFTLVHELAHIWLGQTGVSGVVEGETTTPQGRIEQFCNDVAGGILLPDAAFADDLDFESDDAAQAARAISRMADAWRVSESMVAYRMRRMNWLSGSVYRGLMAQFATRWQSDRARMRDEAQDAEGGPSYYTVKQSKIGNALLGLVQRAIRGDVLSHTKAAKILGVNAGIVEPLLRRYESSAGAIVPGLRRE